MKQVLQSLIKSEIHHSNMTSETKQDVLQIERQQSNGSADLNKVGPMFDKQDYSGAHEVNL